MRLAKVEPFNAVEPHDDDIDFSVSELAEEELKVSAIDAEPKDLLGSGEDPMGEETREGLLRLADFVQQKSQKEKALKGQAHPQVFKAIQAYIKVKEGLNCDQSTGLNCDKSA